MSGELDDVDRAELAREAAAQRKREHSVCPECNGRGGRHSQGCPEDTAADEEVEP